MDILNSLDFVTGRDLFTFNQLGVTANDEDGFVVNNRVALQHRVRRSPLLSRSSPPASARWVCSAGAGSEKLQLAA